MDRLKQIGWWYWFLAEVLVATGIFYSPKAFLWAIVLVLWQVLYFAVVDKKFVTFTVQVRLGFLLILLIGQIQGMEWIYWVPLVGLFVMLTTGYCFLARFMSILPGIRKEPLTLALLKRVFFSPPIKGSIFKAHTGKC